MTNKKIMAIIKEENNNPLIKWSIVENTPERIVLTNDYDEGIYYTIEIRGDGIDEWIRVSDKIKDIRISILLKYEDYDHIEEGFLKGISKAIDHFNYYY